jgi:hypothetical protein
MIGRSGSVFPPSSDESQGKNGEVDADETLARKSTKLVEKLIIFGQ